MKQLNRRRFLYCVGGFGGLVGLSSAVWSQADQPSQCATLPQDNLEVGNLQSVARRSWALGSAVSITVLHQNESQANRAIEAAFAELNLIEDLMSLYRPNSQLSRLNRDRMINGPHPYLVDLLLYAQSVSEKTNGAFDITVQPLWELFLAAQRAGKLPSDTNVEATRDLVDWRRVEIGSKQLRLRGDGVKVTLNGIAQGFAADRVTETLRDHGIVHALIDTGEIGALGIKPPVGGWTVGIQHPRQQDAYISLAKLAERSLATSGDYATTFSEDHRHNHLFNPRTGHSPTGLSSVSIAANSALQADALSTAVFVMGLDAGSTLIRQTPEVDAMLVAKDGRTMVTAGFPTA